MGVSFQRVAPRPGPLLRSLLDPLNSLIHLGADKAQVLPSVLGMQLGTGDVAPVPIDLTVQQGSQTRNADTGRGRWNPAKCA